MESKSPQGTFLRSLGVEYPIIQAPMGGGATTPELVAAVCNAGGLGSLAAAYLKPDQISEDIKRIRSLTSLPFNVNLFAGGYNTPFHVNGQQMLDVLSEIHEALNLPGPTLPVVPTAPVSDQLEAILDARPAIFSFTFGMPSRGVMDRIKARGITTIGTATTSEEAALVEQRGVTAIVAQGAEAGAPRGTFAPSFDSAMVTTLQLVEEMPRRVAVPVIASGGLMDGQDIADSFARGAAAAQLGTAFLPCPECGISESYKQAVLTAQSDPTVVTRAFSGRPARGIANTFIHQLKGREEIILPYPLQNILTRPMRNAAARIGNSGFQSLWAGQGVARARALPVAVLVKKLVEELENARAQFTSRTS